MIPEILMEQSMNADILITIWSVQHGFPFSLSLSFSPNIQIKMRPDLKQLIGRELVPSPAAGNIF